MAGLRQVFICCLRCFSGFRAFGSGFSIFWGSGCRLFLFVAFGGLGLRVLASAFRTV